MSTPKLKHFDWNPKWVLYQDDDIVIFNKPSGLLSVPGRGEDKQHSAWQLLNHAFGEIHTVHRLDMDTSGIMVFARNKAAHRDLSIQFQDRKTDKSYIALACGRLEQPEGHIGLPMRCDWERRPLQMIDFKLGKHALTQYQLLAQNSDNFRIRLVPVTGRSHQLRLHLKVLGHPILGDNLYADQWTRNQSSRLCLHAERLSIRHPTTHVTMQFEQAPDF